MFHATLFPRAKTAVLTTLDRITAPVTDFIRGNPIVSTAAVGIGTAGLVTGVAAVTRVRRKRKKAKARTKKRKVTRRKRKKRACPVKRVKRRKKRGIIRGRGLGSREIRHSGRKTKGKFKLVSFRDKRTGKMVRFKARK